jgi:hypothetical protein
MNSPKNISASVKARLQNVANQRGEEFNLILNRYGIERVLYRLSVSKHSNAFLLKGAMLFTAWDDIPHRPTRDLDLLGIGPTLREAIEATFRRRKTPLPSAPEPFPDAFGNDDTKQVQWSGFVRRNQLSDVPSQFPEVVKRIGIFANPVLHSPSPPENWHPKTDWR